jgi:hypothetical protein
MKTKSHLKETPMIIKGVIEDLIDIIQDLAEESFKPNEIKAIIDEKFIIDISHFANGDQRLIEGYLKTTEELFKNLNKHKLQELKPSVKIEPIEVHEVKVEPTEIELDLVDGRVKPLTNEDLELLMSHFQDLDKERKSYLLKMLYHIESTDPERFKLLKSPF